MYREALKSNSQKKVDKFLAGILKGEIDSSYDELFAGSVIEAKKQAVQMVKKQTRTVLNLYGKAIDEVFAIIAEAIKNDKVIDMLKGPPAHTGFARLT